MRAVVHDRYGPPDVLRIEEVERPVPRDDEVGLVKMGIPRYTEEKPSPLQGAHRGLEYRAVIDRRHALKDVIEATRYVETGQKTGNVVLIVIGDGATRIAGNHAISA